MLTETRATTILVWVVYVWVLEMNKYINKSYDWYRFGQRDKRVCCTLPGWAFGILWKGVLDPTLTAGAIVYMVRSEGTQYYVPVFVLLVVTVYLKHQWSVWFWDYNNTGVSLAIAWAMWLTSIPVVVLVGLTSEWVAFGLLMPYTLFIPYAIWMNWQWFRYALPTTSEQLAKVAGSGRKSVSKQVRHKQPHPSSRRKSRKTHQHHHHQQLQQQDTTLLFPNNV